MANGAYRFKMKLKQCPLHQNQCKFTHLYAITMAHFATKRFNYWGQLGTLTAFCGAGLIVGGLSSLLPLIGKMNLSDFTNDNIGDIVTKLMVPENATIFRWMQFISTFFLFFVPPVMYAWVCHQQPFKHLGFAHSVNAQQAILVILMMLACLPLVSGLQEITEKLPWSKATLLQFKDAETEYNKEVMVIARMNNFYDYLVSLVMIAFLPALFEETIFRGGIQNLLSRWTKAPILSILITAIIFSAVHGSYLGFLSRFALGFILGWVYYRTGNIWLNSIGHFFNNGFAITALYLYSKPGQKVDMAAMEDHFPFWVMVPSVLALYGLFVAFEKQIKSTIDRPGQEVPMPDDVHSYTPIVTDIQNTGDSNPS